MYNAIMIKSFADPETARIFRQEFSQKLPQDIQATALKKLIMIDKAASLNDLRVPPKNHLEKLSGDRRGQFSIRINDTYRMCFRPVHGGFADVEIVNYH